MKNDQHFKLFLTFAVIVSVSILNGCNKSNPDVAKDSEPKPLQIQPIDNSTLNAVQATNNLEQSPAKLNQQNLQGALPSPNAVVSKYLAALQNDDTNKAERMLTSKVRSEIKKANFTLRSPGSPNTTYDIGSTTYATNDQNVAHVKSVWTTQSSAGQSDQFSITWVLHKDYDDSWKVAGMLTSVAPGQPEIFLDFASPRDMLARVESASAVPNIDGNQIQQVNFEQDLPEK